ncbi:MAG: DUF1830 domain-containing protein [Tolypothrix sp. T3-bin4]|nr:DUF1830 domain-containing protein [Tolypothrix sp. T3-bin4]
MNSILASAKGSLASECNHQLLCLHINVSSHLQIIRIVTIPKVAFERVIFPGQRLLFEAEPETQVEIHTSEDSYYVAALQQLATTEAFSIK